MTNLSMLVVINFTLLLNSLQSWQKTLTPYHLLLILSFLLLVILILLLAKRPNMKNACILFAITFGALCMVSLVGAGVTMIYGERDDEAASETYEPMTLAGDHPNVYYFLFDEYGGYENLKHYYDYDNTPFLSELENRGFTVSNDSHNTESVWTVTLIPNLLNMNYVATDSMTTKERNELLEMPNFFRTFADNGYQINLINHLNYFGGEGCNVLTRNQAPQTISDYLLQNSLYVQNPDLKKEINQRIKADYIENYTGPLFNALDAEENCWKYVGDQPTLTMGYVQCPHAPTILDENGNLVDNYEKVGWKWNRHNLYLGQLKFISGRILEIVDGIQENDPNALIIVQSDHGCRQAVHYYRMEIWKDYNPTKQNPYMQNCLNCVYYHGESFQIEGQTGINSLRLILNQVFDTNYDMIDPIVSTKKESRHKKAE